MTFDVAVFVMNQKRKNRHNQKGKKVYALSKFLVKTKKNCEGGNQNCSASHTQATKNARDKPSQNKIDVNHFEKNLLKQKSDSACKHEKTE